MKTIKPSRLSSDWIALTVLCLGIAAGSAPARPLGIDVSSFQGTINWTSVKNSGRTFAWAKATEGTYYFDAYFTGNENNAKAAGVLIGAYHFARPDVDKGTAGADAEAAFFWNHVKDYIKDNGSYLIPMLDYEQSPGSSYSKATSSDWVNEWCQKIVDFGKANGVVVRPVVYTYSSFATTWLDSSVTQWPLWMADYNGQSSQSGSPTTSPWSVWTFWQYSSSGSIPGISGSVDEDVINGDASTLQAFVIGTGTVGAGPGVTLHWDPGTLDAAPGSGGGGNWDNSRTNWWISNLDDTSWSTGGDYAVFDGNAGTVTLQSDVSANELKFNTDGYTLAGGHTLTLLSPADILVPPGNKTMIQCVLGGAGYKVSGGGILALQNTGNTSGSSSSAEWVIGPDTKLTVGNNHCAGSAAVTLNLSNGGAYQNNDSTDGDQFVLSGSAIALLNGGGVLNNPNASLTMSGYITGGGGLTFNGAAGNTLTLNNTANDWTGGTLINGPGTLKASAAGVLGDTSGPVTVNGGILVLGTATHHVGVVTISGGTIQNGTLVGTSYLGQSGTVFAGLGGVGSTMTKSTSGTLTLSGTNNYTGNTTINAGTLALGAPGSIDNTPLLTINGGATYDVSAIANYTLSGNTTLKTTGSAAPATIVGGTTVNLGSQPITVNYDGSNPSLTISQGTLSLHGNAFTVNKSIALAGGTYNIIHQASGNISSTGSYSVTGTAIPSGASASIAVNTGNVQLTVINTTTTTLNSLSASAYGQSVTFTATVSPAPFGGTVQFYDNGVALGGPVTLSGGAASYSTSVLAGGSHPITASYIGTPGFGASSTISPSIQQVNLPPNTTPVSISGTKLLGSGAAQMNFTGVQGYTYVIQATDFLVPPVTWTNLSTNVADINGHFSFTDQDATNHNDRFYRTAVQ